MPDLDQNLDELTRQRQMTHYPEPPNPAAPYLRGALGFGHGGLQGLAESIGMQTPQQSQNVGHYLTNPDIEAAMGMMMPLWGTGIRMGEPTLSEAARLRGKPSNENLFGIRSAGEQTSWSLREHGVSDDFINRLWSDYTSYHSSNAQSPEQILKSGTIYGGAKHLAQLGNIPVNEAFAMIANKIFQRIGANRYITPQQANYYINQIRGGLKVVVPNNLQSIMQQLNDRPMPTKGKPPSQEKVDADIKKMLDALKNPPPE